jgi:hypothetical protein
MPMRVLIITMYLRRETTTNPTTRLSSCSIAGRGSVKVQDKRALLELVADTAVVLLDALHLLVLTLLRTTQQHSQTQKQRPETPEK